MERASFTSTTSARTSRTLSVSAARRARLAERNSTLRARAATQREMRRRTDEETDTETRHSLSGEEPEIPLPGLVDRVVSIARVEHGEAAAVTADTMRQPARLAVEAARLDAS